MEEIEGRVDASIIAYEFQEGGQSHCRFSYHGGFSAALGLAKRFEHRLLWEDREDREEATEF